MITSAFGFAERVTCIESCPPFFRVNPNVGEPTVIALLVLVGSCRISFSSFPV